MPASDSQETVTLDRRRVLQALGVGAASGLAGCGSDDDGDVGSNIDDDSDSDELGERVPTISMEYWSNLGGNTTIMENAAPVIQEGIQENLGVEVEVVPVEFTTQINNTVQDKRTHHVGFWYHTSTPDRLDPEEMTRRYAADWAGGNGQANPSNYASCEYTDPAVAQGNAPDPETRQQLVTEAHSTMSEDLATLQIFPTALFGAIRTDQVTPQRVGEAGVVRTNPYFYLYSESDRDQVAAVDTPVAMETTNFPIIDSSAAQAIWNHLVHSTLTEYDENHELQNVLASNVEIEDEGSRITVELEDATFHNGDPITAEDVRYTYRQLWENPGAYPQASSPDYDSINVVDDRTTEFVFPDPFLPLIQKIFPRWGIFHRQTWVDGNAMENPEKFEMDPVIGSGPFELRNLESGTSMDLTPHDGHPVHSPDYDLFLQAFRNQQTAFQAFQAGEVQMAPNLSPGILERISDEMSDVAETFERPGFMHFVNYPQTNWSPCQFREFRVAWGAAIDRQKATELGVRGAVEPETYSCPLGPGHPFRPPEEELTQMAPPEGDPEKAQQALSDAGWGWDDENRLHYPADKDLSPKWPEEETPSPEDFPCVSEDGEYVPPEER